jgi:hypothetical protein
MENNALDKFLENMDENNTSKKNNSVKKEQTVTKKDGLIERVDKKLVTEDGRQLLKEQLYEGN